jgi:hypothetical protein
LELRGIKILLPSNQLSISDESWLTMGWSSQSNGVRLPAKLAVTSTADDAVVIAVVLCSLSTIQWIQLLVVALSSAVTSTMNNTQDDSDVKVNV